MIPTVLWNPSIQASGPNFGVQSNQFGFDITGTTNIPIVAEASTNLAQSVCVPLQSMTLTNGLVHFSEPLQSNGPARFYRIGAPRVENKSQKLGDRSQNTGSAVVRLYSQSSWIGANLGASMWFKANAARYAQAQMPKRIE
jgi:hypothetical protein